MKLMRHNIKKYNDFKLHNKMKLLIFILIIIIILSLILYLVSCKTGKDLREETSESLDATNAGDNSTDSADSENPVDDTEVVPAEITSFIKTADEYYESGEYKLANDNYRKAETAINNLDLSEHAKKELKDSFYLKYMEAREIVETAGIHYANAMMLEYEQRYDEAKIELEAALTIYPKYSEALETYESLKIIMGIE